MKYFDEPDCVNYPKLCPCIFFQQNYRDYNMNRAHYETGIIQLPFVDCKGKHGDFLMPSAS